MKTYTLSFGQAIGYEHPNPERTAWKPSRDDRQYRVWPNRKSMALSIRMQEKRAARQSDWRPIVGLETIEGF